MVQFPLIGISMLVMTSLWIAASIFMITLFRKYKNNIYIVLLLAASFLSCWGVLMALAYITPSADFLRWSMTIFAIGLIMAVLFFDLIWRETPSLSRMSIVISLGVLVFALGFYPDSIVNREVEGFIVPYWSGEYLFVCVLLCGTALSFCFQTIITLWLKMPRYLRRKMRGIVPGVIIFAPGSLVGWLLFRNFLSISIVACVGIAIIGYYGVRNPEMFYVLPFTVHRLIVLHKDSGINCFDYQWTESKVDGVLLSGLIKALQQISHDLLNVGDIRELNLDEGILILKETKLTIAGVFASNSSKYLRSCLNNFMDVFEKNYQEDIVRGANDSCKFESAIQLVAKYFANIPRLAK